MNPKLILFGAGVGLVLVVAAAWAASKIPDLGKAAAGAVGDAIDAQGGVLTVMNPYAWLLRQAQEAAGRIVGGGELLNDVSDFGLDYDIAYGSGGPVFQETPGGAVTGILRFGR